MSNESNIFAKQSEIQGLCFSKKSSKATGSHSAREVTKAFSVGFVRAIARQQSACCRYLGVSGERDGGASTYDWWTRSGGGRRGCLGQSRLTTRRPACKSSGVRSRSDRFLGRFQRCLFFCAARSAHIE